MAVYTKINTKDVLSLAKKFDLGKIVKFQGIKQGIENTNYLLKSNNKKYILTIFEKRVKTKDIPFFMNLMDKLNQHKINCPKPLKDKNNKYLTLIKNKAACIVTFVNGKDKKNLNNKDCYEVGKNIGKLHKVASKINLYRKNSMSINNLNSLLKIIKFRHENITPNLEYLLKTNLKKIKKEWPKNLPKSIIHGDLFIDNIFFKKNKFAGFIDFYFSCNDYSIYEIAICINALCFDKKNNKFVLNKKKVKSLIKGYQFIKRISQKEKNALNVLCKGAALRYLLTRVYDYFNTPKTALIKIKDPKEYLQKLIIHNSLNSYKDYYN
jgi:homoserine kinase type II